MTDPSAPRPEGDGPPDVPGEDATSQRRLDRLKAAQARVVDRIESTRQRLEDARPNSRLIDTVFGAVESDVDAGGGVLAGAVAFRVFLFFVPYMFLIVTVFGLGASAGNEDPAALARDAGVGGLAAQAFSSVGDLSTTERLVSLVLVGFALLLATRALLKVLRIVHALVWRTRAGKPPSVARAAGALMLIVTLALAFAALIGKLRSGSFVVGLIATVLFVAVPTAAWLFVSWHLPHAPGMPWTALVPGALFFGFGVEVLHLVTVYWIARQVESKTSTYGAIGFALALLLWAYLLGRLVTSAAVINATLWRRDEARRHRRAGRSADDDADADSP
jgi:uncharacterized BrkB/YihY/UPF0761 family membrane protein